MKDKFIQRKHDRTRILLCVLQVQMVAGKYHSLIVDRNGKLYACGSGLHGILGQGPDIKCCQLPTRIALPNLPGLQIKQISGSHNHAAFITQAGEVCESG